MSDLGWIEGYVEYRRKGAGRISAEQSGGRRYFYARVDFPPPTDWWPRTTETSTLSEAREWVEAQLAEWYARGVRPATAIRTQDDEDARND